MAAFPAAGACVELLLAQKKDVVYESEVKNLLRDLLERCFGTHLLSQLLPELTSASALLYYLLVLGRKRPQQTLGEEYCDVMRVVNDQSPSAKLPVVQNVGFARHVAWLVLAVLPQYAAARSQTGWLNLSQLTWSPRERMAQQLRLQQATAAASGQATDTAPQSTNETALRSLLARVDRLVAQLKALATALQAKVLPAGYEFSVAPLQQWLSQLHLAAFYVSARFLQVAKRLSRIEYMFVRKDLHPALNLSLLGYLMTIRLASAALGELRGIRKMHKAEAKLKLGSSSSSHANAVAVRVPTAMPSSPVMETAFSTGRPKKCALCLGERTSPATTPCGHVFCWECIVGWCQKNKPECPICRQEAHPQQIKCVYNYN